MSNIEIIVSEEKDDSIIAQWNKEGECLWVVATEVLSEEQLDAFKKVNLVLDNPSIILRLVMWVEWKLSSLEYLVKDLFRKNTNTDR